MSKLLGELVNIPPERNTFTESDRFLLPKTFIGIEIEVEGVRTPKQLQLWEMHRDGSLRNNGIEYASHKAFGQDIILALDEIINYLSRVPGATFSSRTSVHIHIDARDMQIEELTSMFLLYLLFEKDIVSFHRNVREDNIFCLPYYKSDFYLQFAGALFNEDTFLVSLENFDKYSAMNFLPITQRGSIEFRHMPGNIDKEYIINWINIIMALKKAARKIPYDRIPNLFSSNPRGFYQDIMGETALKFSEHSIPNCYNGINVIQQIAHVDFRKIARASNLIPEQYGKDKDSAPVLNDVVRPRARINPAQFNLERGQVQMDQGAIRGIELNRRPRPELFNEFFRPNEVGEE